ncbi:hypothetical protein GCM10022392_21850 [Mucilaginibacter panaciglaebae]|uniref:Gliding motility-associated-like protein n=1 Tax=Mucilaginibacter panaciglaebae TaxID=502331 RepID=A0ABP7WVH1_9SPHI
MLSPEWFNDIGSPGNSTTATAVKTDASGNVYVIGYFTGTVDFDPSASTANLGSPPGSTSGFIVKYKADGTYVWAYTLGGTNVKPTALTIGTDGSITIIGNFSGAVDAGPTIGINALTSFGGSDVFITHLNQNAGFIWAKTIGGTNDDFGNKVASDGAGVYVALQFQSTVDVGGTSYTAKGTTDGMLVKYDLTGNVVFALDLGYTGVENTASGVAVDRNGNIDVIGFLNGPINFNPLGPAYALSAPQKAMYIAQYLPDGKLNWVKDIEQGFPNTAVSSNNNINMSLDGSDNIYVAGAFTGTAKFNTSTSLTAKGNTDLFVARYTSAGLLTLNKNIGKAGGSIVPTDIGITTDNQYYYVTGYFTGSIDFSTNANTSIVNYHGQQDLFLAKYNQTDGNIVVNTNVGNNSCAIQSNALAITNNNKVMMIGTFCSSSAFGGACTTFNESAKGSTDMFLAEYSQPKPIVNNVIVNPANCGGSAGTLQGSTPTGGIDTYTYEWQRSTDSLHYTEIFGETAKDYSPPAETGVVYYLRKVFSGPCVTPSLSNVLTVDPSKPLTIQNNFIIPPTEPLSGCGGAGALHLNGSLPTGGGGGPYSYDWQMSFDTVNWTALLTSPVSTPSQQNLGAISYLRTFYVRRVVRIPGCNIPSISPTMTFTAVARLDNITIHATGATEFCNSGDPGTLTSDRSPTGGTGVYTYQWKSTTTNDFQNIPGATSADYKPGVLTKTTFFKREVLSGPCYTGDPGNNSNAIIVTIKQLAPVANNTISQATPDGALCLANADPSMITGSIPAGGAGDIFFQWQQSSDNVNFIDITGATNRDFDPPKITGTTYYRRVVTSSGASSCSIPSMSNILTVSVQTANVSNNTISQFVPDSAMICSIPAKPKKITGSNATGSGFSYQWQSSTNGVNFTDIANEKGKDLDPKEITQTTSYRRAAVVPGGCAAPLYSNILTINVSPIASSNIITAPATTVFCDIGKAEVIKGSEVSGNGVHYQWQSSTDSLTFSDITDQGNYPDYAPLLQTSTVYYRRAVSTAVCNVPSVSKVVAIKIFQTPVVKLSADSVYICLGDNVTLTASGGTQYKWSPSDGLSSTDHASLSASPKTTTTYIVTVSNEGSCSVTGLIKVIVVPRVIVNAGADKRIFRGESTRLEGKVTGADTHYSWSPTTYLDDPNSLAPLVTPPKTTTYTLTVTTDHGCSITTDEVKINVYERVIIPTGFTPNNDGKNDLWEIPSLATYPGSVLTVFGRSGVAVFRSVNYAKTWDGTNQGKPLPFGTYYYVIDLKDGTQPLSGWVSLIR